MTFDRLFGVFCFALRGFLALACPGLMLLGMVVGFSIYLRLLALLTLALAAYLLVEAWGLRGVLGLLLAGPVLAIRFCPFVLVALLVVPVLFAAGALFLPFLLVPLVVWRLLG